MNNYDVTVTNNLAGGITVNVERLHGNEGNGGSVPPPPDNTRKFTFKSKDHLTIKIRTVNHDITNLDYIKYKSGDDIEVYIRNNFWKLRIEPKQPGFPSTNVEVGTRDTYEE